MLLCSFVGAWLEVSAVVVVKYEQFEPRDSWDAPVGKIPFIECKKVPDVM